MENEIAFKSMCSKCANLGKQDTIPPPQRLHNPIVK